MAIPSALLGRGTRAAQPSAATLAPGCTWCIEDENFIVEQVVAGTPNTWEPYSATGAGTGDVNGPAASVDKEIALFDATSGKLLERATGTGYVKVTSGVMGVPAATVPVADGGTNLTSYTAGDVPYATGATTLAKLAIGTAGQVLTVNAGATAPEWGPAVSVVVQKVKTQTGAVNTGTTTIPVDDTIPQNTEGTEFMTLAITPTDAANRLEIVVRAILASSSAPRNLCAALFQDTTADALACANEATSSAGFMHPVEFMHDMAAGTTSATTFKVRAGVETSGTVTFNGSAGARLYGGVLASSITITEYVP